MLCASFRLRLWKQCHSCTGVRRLAMQDRRLWEIFRYILHGGWYRISSRDSNRRRDLAQKWRELRGLDRFLCCQLRIWSYVLCMGQSPCGGLWIGQREHLLSIE